MAAPTARYDKGTFTDSPCSQEANMLLDSLDAEPSRETKKWKSIVNGCNVLRRDENPSLKWSAKGKVTAVGGFVTQHIGTPVTTFANFSTTFAGFDPSVGTLTFIEPKHSWTIGDLRGLDFAVEHDPFVS